MFPSHDLLESMDPADAIRMENIFPSTENATLRNGFTSYATSLTSSVQTLAEWVGDDGSTKFLAAADTSIWDISATGSGTKLASSLTNDKWQFVNFMDKLVLVNGADTPRQYDDGGGLATLTITGTGLTATDIINVSVYKQRLYYITDNTASVWYGSTSTVGGATTELDLSDVLSLGGELMFAGSVTRDTGSGMVDAFGS